MTRLVGLLLLRAVAAGVGVAAVVWLLLAAVGTPHDVAWTATLLAAGAGLGAGVLLAVGERL